MRFSLLACMVSAALLLLVGGISPPVASADTLPCVAVEGGQGCLLVDRKYGDAILAFDLAKDGFHVEVYWSISRTYTGVCKNVTGADENGGLHGCRTNFAPGSTVCFRVAVLNKDDIKGRPSGTRCARA